MEETLFFWWSTKSGIKLCCLNTFYYFILTVTILGIWSQISPEVTLLFFFFFNCSGSVYWLTEFHYFPYCFCDYSGFIFLWSTLLTFPIYSKSSITFYLACLPLIFLLLCEILWYSFLHFLNFSPQNTTHTNSRIKFAWRLKAIDRDSA